MPWYQIGAGQANIDEYLHPTENCDVITCVITCPNSRHFIYFQGKGTLGMNLNLWKWVIFNKCHVHIKFDRWPLLGFHHILYEVAWYSCRISWRTMPCTRILLKIGDLDRNLRPSPHLEQMPKICGDMFPCHPHLCAVVWLHVVHLWPLLDRISGANGQPLIEST